MGPWVAVSLRTCAAVLAVSHCIKDGLEQITFVEFVVDAVELFGKFPHPADSTVLEKRVVEVLGAGLGTGRDLWVVAIIRPTRRNVVLVRDQLVPEVCIRHCVAGVRTSSEKLGQCGHL